MLPAALFGLLAVAAAAPFDETAMALAPRNNGAEKTVLVPHVHPDVNRADLTNIHAKQSPRLYYDSNPDPANDSTIATLAVPNAPYPIVQLENTQYIKSVNCSNNQAHIAFTNQTAYEAAVKDWSQHSQFIFISYNPNCGSGLDGRPDFALVDKMTPDDGAMTVDTDIKFVNYQTAIGNQTVVHAAIGKYTAPVQKRTSVSKSLDLSWNEYPTSSLSDNQWGSGYQLLQSSTLDVICVGCGTKGDLTLEGEVDFSFFSGFQSASVSLKGNMAASLAVGMDARGVSGSIPIASHQLAQIPIGAVEIPDIISIGPQIDISVGATLELQATGSLLLGADLSWPSVDIELGLSGDDTQTGNGLTPTVTPKDSVSGTLTATLDLHLPVSIGIGINILDGTWNKSLAIVDTPGFQLTGSKSTDPGSCSGVELSADIYNNVGADILEVTTFALASWTQPLWSTCLFGSTGTPSATSAATSPVATSVRPTYTTTLVKTVRRSSSVPSVTASPPPPSSTPKAPATTPRPTYTAKPSPPPKSSPAPPPKPTTSTTAVAPKPTYSTNPTPSSTPKARRVMRDYLGEQW